MRGIILAGGTGSRLNPLNIVQCKQLLPVYDKPLIYYPLSALMLADITDILIICNDEDLEKFENLLGDGAPIGLKISYAVQKQPNGIPEALVIGEKFLNGDSTALILGDNIFYGQFFINRLQSAIQSVLSDGGAAIFTYPVKDPQNFGIAEIDQTGRVISLEEKPAMPKSNRAVTGLYIFDASATLRAKELKKSARGETEITDLNKDYLRENQLIAFHFGRGFTWLDAGTPRSLHDASSFIKIIEDRQGFKIACLEEIALNKGWITRNDVIKASKKYPNSDYSKYLAKVATER